MSITLSRILDRIFGYDFFLSYSHRDGKNYPKLLKARLEQAGFKVFLDQTEYAPGVDLRRETRRQVEKSQKLVVIARANAIKSVWVKREVEVILARGLTPILIDVNNTVASAPPDAELAVLAREQHWLRLMETSIDPDGIPTDYAVSELTRSFGVLRQDVKRQRILGAAAAGFALLAVLSGYLAWLSNERRREADMRLDTTLETATRFVNQTVQMSDKYGVPREFVLQLLKEPEQVFLQLAHSGTDTPEVRQRRAQTLLDFSDNYELLGDSEQRLARAREAKVILEELVRKSPTNLDWQLRLATAFSKVGTALLFRGDRSAADAEYEQALRLRKGLAEAYPKDRKVQRDYSVALNRKGEILISLGRYEDARGYIRRARDLRRRLSELDPENRQLRRDIIVCQIWLGDSLKAEQRFTEARAEYLVALEIAEVLMNADSGSKNASRDLSVSLNKVGETYLAEKDSAKAKLYYERALPVREQLALDGSNRAAQRDLFVSYVQLGHIAFSEKQIGKARDYFGHALELSEKLFEKDRNYAQWQADAAEAKGWLGMVAKTGGKAMIRQAIVQLDTMRREGRLVADREVLIAQFRDLVGEQAEDDKRKLHQSPKVAVSQRP